MWPSNITFPAAATIRQTTAPTADAIFHALLTARLRTMFTTRIPITTAMIISHISLLLSTCFVKLVRLAAIPSASALFNAVADRFTKSTI